MKMRYPHIMPLSACLAGLCLQAQQVPGTQDLGKELDEIVNTDQIQAAGKKVQNTTNVPADAVILRSADLRALGYRTLGEAVAGVVGFRTNEDHAYQGLGVRGLYVLGDQNTRVLILLDGHSLNSPSEVGSSKVGEDFGLPIELIDRIELVRGPASSLYGNNAFQALINVVSVDAAESRNAACLMGIDGSSNGSASAWVDGGKRLGSLNISVAARGFQRTGTGQYYPQLNDAFPGTLDGALPSNADREESQSAYLRVHGNNWSFAGFVLSRTQRLASAPFAYLPGDTENFYRNRRLSAEFKWEPRTESIRWMFRLFGDRNEFEDGFVADPLRGTAGNLEDWDPDRSLGLEAQGQWQLHERFSLTFGTEQRLHRFSGRTWNEDGPSSILSSVDYRIGNTYLEGTWQAAKQWSLVAGLQIAEWDPSRIHYDAGGTGSDIPQEGIQRLTPRLSVLFTPGPRDVLKLVLGQGFRFPTIFERYYTDNVPDLATEHPNPALKPEVMNNEQLIWMKNWNPRLHSQLSISLFQWQNQITAQADDMNAVQYQNTSEDIHGKALEGECGWRFGRTEFSTGVGWYQWTMGSDHLGNVSQWNGVLKVIHRIGEWSFSAETRYVDGRTTMDGTSDVPPAWTLRGSARYETRRGWAQLTVEDLTNSRRRDLVAQEYDPITWMEADTRSARLSIGMRF